MRLHEEHEKHYTRVLPRSAVVLIVGAIFYAVFLIWAWNSVPNFNLFLFQAIVALIIAASTFIAGNTYRLRDFRRRDAYRLSVLRAEDQEKRHQGWVDLVPPSTITFRFRVALGGSAFGVLSQMAIVFIFVQLGDPMTGIVAAFLVLVLAGVLFLAGTYTRPVD